MREDFIQVRAHESDTIYTYINCRHIIIYEVVQTSDSKYTLEFTTIAIGRRFLYCESFNDKDGAIYCAANLFYIHGRENETN